MSIGLVGRKCGMSRVFTDDGRSIPVTLIEATPNRITQVKTVENDGYTAIQVTTGTKRARSPSMEKTALPPPCRNTARAGTCSTCSPLHNTSRAST